MNKIQTEKDVLDWAESMVKANGEKFTPLSKGEQFLIAKFIFEQYMMCAGNRHPVPDEDKPVPETIQHTDESVPRADGRKDDGVPSESGDGSPQEPVMRMSRGAAFHLAGHSAQKAYDEFLTWCKEHPQDSSVMDFSNGKTSVAAAYAYWLHEIMDVRFNPKG